MSEDDQFAPHLFGPRAAQQGSLPYPTQSREPPESPSFAGELRGYYGRSEFNPYSSGFGDVRNGGTQNHGGVDIYAPFSAYPHEVPVHAVCAGRVEFVFDQISPNSLGNRAWLYPAHAPHDRLILGHLNRFVGHDRKVEMNELIGFSGCSGNADTGGECSTLGPLRVNSGHVHLSYRSHPTGVEQEPLARLGWSLRFADVIAPISLLDWKQQGHLLDEPPAPDFVQGILRADRSRRTERLRKSSKPSKLAEPFRNIDFDHRPAIARTAAFYELVHARLSGEQDDLRPELQFHRHTLKAFEKSLGECRQLRDRLLAIVEELRSLKMPPPEMPAAQRIRRAHTRTVEFQFVFLRMMWLAMGGAALLPVARHPGEQAEAAVSAAGRTVAGGAVGCVPASGLGISGKSYLVAIGNAQAALHASYLSKLVPDQADAAREVVEPFSRWTLSVTFGAGTPWHAWLDHGFVKEVESQTGAIKAYAPIIYHCAWMVCLLSRLMCGQSSVDEETLPTFLSSVVTMLGLIVGDAGEESSASDQLLDVLDAIRSDGATLALLRAIAKTSAAAALQAGVCLDPKVSQLERVRNAYDGIWIET